MYDIGFLTKSGEIIHANADTELDCGLLEVMLSIEKDLDCKIISIQRVFIEKEKKNEKKES